jgi:two-component system sensor histidine kinase UhpB
MRARHMLFSRRYRAALLDYLLSGDEAELARAYDLGRTAVNEGLGLLVVLRTHQREVGALIESAPDHDRSLRRLNAAQTFLMETLSVFEMTHRGYVALIGGKSESHDHRRRRVRRH